MSGGGLPRGMATLLFGGPGSGKTVFALQSLVGAARRDGEPGLFVSFEEDPRRIELNARGFDWDLAALTQRRGRRRPRLAIFDARLAPDVIQAGHFDLGGMLAQVAARAEAIGARRIVLDGLDVLLALLNDPARERQEIHRLHHWLQERELTAILTAKCDPFDAGDSYQPALLHFMVDCLVQLRQRQVERVSNLTLRIIKYRGARFARNEAPFTVTAGGIAISNVSEAELDYPVSSQRVSSGVRRLDEMLHGGYFRGSATLISGAPGTAKSTLAAAFALAACRRGERVLYVSFDEAGGQLMRNLTSVGMNLAAHERAGRLRLLSPRADSRSADDHLLAIDQALRAHRPRCLVIDPICALLKAGDTIDALAVAQAILREAKSAGITSVCTSLVGANRHGEDLAMQVSTLADTWIQVSYVIRSGERNRALSIVKSRGTRHSDQVRELMLGPTGVTLADAYAIDGDVLMGTARWQAEENERECRARDQAEIKARRAGLRRDLRELAARGDALQRELAARRAELATLGREANTRQRQQSSRQREVHRRRTTVGQPALARAGARPRRRGRGARHGGPGGGR